MEKFLIFGGTGYIGNLMVKASLKLGHPTYVFSRPTSTKTDLLHDFQSLGAIIVKGELDEHEKLVSVMKEVDVVISAVAFPQVLDQFKILEAIKVAGNIKRFLPSDFGVEEDRVSVLPAFDALLEKKRKIRRAIEEANIPYTFISPNCCASHFIDFLPRPSDPNHDIIVYGRVKPNDHKCNFFRLLMFSVVNLSVVMNYEQDIGIYTIKVATDQRTCNRVVIYKPSTNVLTQLELISKWEAKIGRNFKKIHFPEEEMVALSQKLPEPQNVPMAILHSILIKGVTANYDLGENDVEASTLYPDLKFATVDEIIDIFLHNPAKPPNEVFE